MGEHTAEACYYLAQARYHVEPENIGPAVDAIGEAPELRAANPWAQALAGRLASEREEYDGSVRFLNEAIRLEKDFVTAHSWLGATYKSMDKSREAATELAEVSGFTGAAQSSPPRARKSQGSRDRLFTTGGRVR